MKLPGWLIQQGPALSEPPRPMNDGSRKPTAHTVMSAMNAPFCMFFLNTRVRAAPTTNTMTIYTQYSWMKPIPLPKMLLTWVSAPLARNLLTQSHFAGTTSDVNDGAFSSPFEMPVNRVFMMLLRMCVLIRNVRTGRTTAPQRAARQEFRSMTIR